jgi:hypothetical protein
MTRQIIIERTLKAINQLPEDKAEEISDFADFVAGFAGAFGLDEEDFAKERVIGSSRLYNSPVSVLRLSLDKEPSSERISDKSFLGASDTAFSASTSARVLGFTLSTTGAFLLGTARSIRAKI